MLLSWVRTLQSTRARPVLHRRSNTFGAVSLQESTGVPTRSSKDGDHNNGDVELVCCHPDGTKYACGPRRRSIVAMVKFQPCAAVKLVTLAQPSWRCNGSCSRACFS